MNQQTAVRITQLSMRFGEICALRGVSAAIPRGAITGLVGPDAAGKTTLIRLLAGLMRPSEGSIAVTAEPETQRADGEPEHSATLAAGAQVSATRADEEPEHSATRMDEKPERSATRAGGAQLSATRMDEKPERSATRAASPVDAPVEADLSVSPEELIARRPNYIGYMPQRFGLYEDLSVMDNLLLHARLRNVTGKAREKLFAELLDFTSLARFTDRLAGRLSGGMKQKLGIACALPGSPRLLLLDEPGVGVDPLSRRDLWRMVTKLADNGMTVVWSTAYLEEAERCPHVIMLNEGTVLYEGAPADLTRRAAGRVFSLTPPAGEKRTALACWTKKECVADALIQGRRVRIVLKELPVQPGGETGDLFCAGPYPPQGKAVQPGGNTGSLPAETTPKEETGNLSPEMLIPGEETGTLSPETVIPAENTRDLPPETELTGDHARTGDTRPDKDDARASLTELEQAGAAPATPRLEDAYMLALGGINHTPSPFGLSENQSGGQCDRASGAVRDNEPVEIPVPRIEARGLTKSYGNFIAADNITFSVAAGNIFGLLGPNGAGKSTTFRMLCGLTKPTRGDCFVDGLNLRTAGNMARARLGYMAQKFSLYTDIPVRANIKIFGSLYGLTEKMLQQRTAVLIPTFGLGPYLNQPARLLPLGQKQRLALLCATLHNPSVLFLDEPTSGVDAGTRRDFWKHITAMTRTGTSVLVTTHFMEEAEYCDEIALVYRGSIISTGTPDALKSAAITEELPDPTMEDTFIASITHYDREHPL